MVPFLLFGASGQSSCWLSGGHSYKRRRSFSFAAMLFWFGWRVVLFLGRILSESKRTESNQEGRQAADIKRYWLVSSCGWFSEASPVHSPDCADVPPFEAWRGSKQVPILETTRSVRTVRSVTKSGLFPSEVARAVPGAVGIPTVQLPVNNNKSKFLQLQAL